MDNIVVSQRRERFGERGTKRLLILAAMVG